MKRIPAVLAAACLLAGCAEVSIPTPEAKYDLDRYPMPGKADAKTVADFAGKYAKFSEDIAQGIKQTDVASDAGVLGAAMSAAAALFFAASEVQPQVVAGAGLFAGGLTAWKTRISPKAAAKLYEQTSKRMSCVSVTLAPLDTIINRPMPGGKTFADTLNQDMAVLQAQETATRDALAAASDPTVKKEGDAAITSADAEISVAARLADALNNGTRYGIQEMNLIIADLSTGLDGQSLDYASLRDSLVSNMQAKAQSQLDVNAAQKIPNVAPPAPPAPGVGPMAAPSPDDIAKKATADLTQFVVRTKQLTDSAAPTQDVKSDLGACRTDNT